MITSFRCIAATTQVLPRYRHQSIFDIKITQGANRDAELSLRVCTTQALFGTGALFRGKPASFIARVDLGNWAYKAETCYSNCDEDNPQYSFR